MNRRIRQIDDRRLFPERTTKGRVFALTTVRAARYAVPRGEARVDVRPVLHFEIHPQTQPNTIAETVGLVGLNRSIRRLFPILRILEVFRAQPQVTVPLHFIDPTAGRGLEARKDGRIGFRLLIHFPLAFEDEDLLFEFFQLLVRCAGSRSSGSGGCGSKLAGPFRLLMGNNPGALQHVEGLIQIIAIRPRAEAQRAADKGQKG